MRSIALALILLFPILNLSADTYRFFDDPANYHPNGIKNSVDKDPTNLTNDAGRVNIFDISYDTDTKRLRFYVELGRADGVMPNAFEFALNDTGADPKVKSNEHLVFVYFDFQDLNNPVLTIYGYNGFFDSYQDCSNVLAGVQAPDRVFTSLDDPNSYLEEIVSVQTDPDTIYAGFTIDASVINNYVSHCPNAASKIWKGIDFTDIIGMWFHPLLLTSSSYDLNGWLTSWGILRASWYDTTAPTQFTEIEDPVCDSPLNGTVSISEQKVQAVFTAGDNQGQDLTVKFGGLPAGATTSIPDGSQVKADTKIVIDWIPTLSQANQSYVFTVELVDPIGATTDCSAKVSVPAVTCESDDIQADLIELDGGTLALRDLITNISLRVKRRRGKLNKGEQADLQLSDDLHRAAWATINNLPGINLACNTNPLCVSISHTDTIFQYQEASISLFTIAKKFARKFARVLRRKGVPRKRARKRKAAIIANARTINDGNQTLADQLPKTSSECSV